MVIQFDDLVIDSLVTIELKDGCYKTGIYFGILSWSWGPKYRMTLDVAIGRPSHMGQKRWEHIPTHCIKRIVKQTVVKT